jgi:hypothetical protein
MRCQGVRIEGRIRTCYDILAFNRDLSRTDQTYLERILIVRTRDTVMSNMRFPYLNR